MGKILVYTFFSYTKVTSKGLFKFEDPNYSFDKLFVSNRFATKKLLEKAPEYDFVIGIADHNKNAVKSRFDPKYINKYSGRTLLENGLEILNSNLEIELPANFYLYKGVTNGPCNRSAYLIMNKILSDSYKTKFGFFHLNKKTWENDLKVIVDNIKSKYL